MQYDLWRFVSVLVLGGLIGILTGFFSLCVIAGLVIFIFWQYKEFSRILIWLQRRNETHSPLQSGLVGDVCREIDFLRARNRSRKQKLSGYLKRFQEATEALPDAVVVLGEQGEIEWANEKSAEYIGIQWPKDVGLRFSNLVRYPELTRYLEANKSVSDKGFQITSPINDKLILEIRIFPYSDIHQKLLVARNITAISQADAMRKDFIANASHELRTPLTVISGYLESFADDDNCPSQWTGFIQQMRSQAARMQRLIQELIQLSSLESGTDRGEKKPLSIPDMLYSIVHEAESVSGFFNHKITLNIDETLHLKAHQQEIHSVFSNLIFNAVQYTPEHGNIHIEWIENDTCARFGVSDNGPGIAPEHIPRLTERFYRIDRGRSREKGGTGLGLAIVKHALAKHDGRLMIDSELGAGSSFRCEFPKALVVHAGYRVRNSLTA